MRRESAICITQRAPEESGADRSSLYFDCAVAVVEAQSLEGDRPCSSPQS
jgi:hypothetical protein